MITNLHDYHEYLMQDAKANKRERVKPHLFGDELWKLQVSLRKLEYHATLKGFRRMIHLPAILYNKLRFHRLSVLCGVSISPFCFGKGLSIAHRGLLVVNSGVSVGENCRIQEGVNIGATNGSSSAPRLGNNIFIGTGAKIIGDIEIADDVAIGANAVVVKSILEPGTTWGGVPAKKISANNSHSNLSPMLEL